MFMWLRVLFFILLSNFAWADNPPMQLFDEGTLQGTIFRVNCTGSAIQCTKSGITGTVNVPSAAGGAQSLTGLNDVASATATAGQLLIANGTKFASTAMSGSCTITSAGVASCSGGANTGVTTGSYNAGNFTVNSTGNLTFAAQGQLTSLSDVASSTKTAGSLLIANGTNYASSTVSGHCTLGAGGYINCDGLGSAKSLTGLSDVGSATITSGKIFIADGTKYQAITPSGHCTVGSGGFINCNGLGAAKSLTGLTDVASATATAGNLLLADGANFQSLTLSGDVTTTSAGVTSIGANKVGATQIVSTTVTAGSYNASNLTVDADGRLTFAAQGQLTSLSDVGSSTKTTGNLLLSDGTNFQSKALSGHCIVGSGGFVNCDGLAAAKSLTGLSDVGSATFTAGRLLVADGTKWQSAVASGSCTVAGDGTFTCSGGSGSGASALTGLTDVQNRGTVASYINKNLLIANGTKFYSGALALTGLTDVASNTATAGNLLIADGASFQSLALSGDVTTTSAGVTAIGTNKVGPTQIASTTVTSGSYNASNITVDADGRLTFAAQGQLTSLSDVASSTKTAGNLMIANGTNYASTAMSGHCTIGSGGFINCNGLGAAKSLTGLSDVQNAGIIAGNTLIANGTKFVSAAMLLTGLSDVGSDTITAGRLLIADGTKFQSSAMTGDISITSAGVTTLAASVITGGWKEVGTNVILTNKSDLVGIGTSAPTNPLTVWGIANIGNASGQSTFDAGLVVNNSAANAAATGAFKAMGSTSSTVLVATDPVNDRVGIGTSATTAGAILTGAGSVTGFTNLDVSGFLRSSTTGSIGWSKRSAANQACNTTCINGCVFGEDTGVIGTLLDCTDATADVCICAGAN